MGIAATLFDSIRAFLISSTVPIATGPATMGDTGLDGTEEGGDLKGGGVLTGLIDGDFDGDLTTGAGSATTASFNGFSWGFLVASNLFPVTSGLLTGPFFGFPISFPIISTLVSGPFSLNFFESVCDFFSISISASIFFSLTIAFDSIFGFVPLSVNGKIVGASFLFVMPSGVSLIFFSNLGVWVLLSKFSHFQNLPQMNCLAFLKFLLLMFLVLFLADLPFYMEYPVYDMGLDSIVLGMGYQVIFSVLQLWVLPP